MITINDFPILVLLGLIGLAIGIKIGQMMPRDSKEKI